MTDPSAQEIRRLALHAKHAECGAKFGAFGEWEVPLYYRSILEEHRAVRGRAGLFDISHMGEFFFAGVGAEKFLEGLLPRPVRALKTGQALYAPMLNEAGGIVDDVVLYKLVPEKFLLIVNAANIEKDFRWIKFRANAKVDLRNESDSKGLLALQGPASLRIMEKVFPRLRLPSLGRYHCLEWESGMIARTGYTGEDGFEIMTDQKNLAGVWEKLFAAGKSEGLVPAGFGARDTLRLEAGMLLYGHDMSDDTTPLEAGLDWAVNLEKDFVGRNALLKQRQGGIKRRLVGFEMIERGIPRQDFEIRKKGKVIGKVTSGSFAPTLEKNIGLGYVAAEESAAGNEIEIMVRAGALKAKIARLPFYKRRSKP